MPRYRRSVGFSMVFTAGADYATLTWQSLTLLDVWRPVWHWVSESWGRMARMDASRVAELRIR